MRVVSRVMQVLRDGGARGGVASQAGAGGVGEAQAEQGLRGGGEWEGSTYAKDWRAARCDNELHRFNECQSSPCRCRNSGRARPIAGTQTHPAGQLAKRRRAHGVYERGGHFLRVHIHPQVGVHSQDGFLPSCGCRLDAVNSLLGGVRAQRARAVLDPW